MSGSFIGKLLCAFMVRRWRRKKASWMSGGMLGRLRIEGVGCRIEERVMGGRWWGGMPVSLARRRAVRVGSSSAISLGWLVCWWKGVAGAVCGILKVVEVVFVVVAVRERESKDGKLSCGSEVEFAYDMFKIRFFCKWVPT